MRAMRAWRAHENGHYRDVLRWEECDPPGCPEDGVVIDVHAASLNFPDLLVLAGMYQVRPPLPLTSGMEAAGVVVAAGPESRFAAGDRVITNGISGAFAERMAAPDARVFRIPEEMTDAHAAALTVVHQTGYFALVHRAALQPGETLLVHGGAGGVGTAAVQLGKALGARVIATAGSPAKLDICRQCGADEVIDYKQEDFVARVKELTDGRGADVIYDPVGGDVFDRSTRCIAFAGRLLVIGFASGRIPTVECNRVLLKNFSVIGLHWGNYFQYQPELIHQCHDALCELYTNGAIRPVIWKQLPLAELPAAMAALESRDSYGTVVVTP